MRNYRSWMSYRLFIGALMTLGLLILVSSPRAAAAQDRLAEIIEKAKKEKDIVFQISEPRGKFSSAQAERMMADLVRKKFGVNLGIKFTTAGHALSLNVTTAIWTALLAHFFIAGDRLERGRFLGILVAYAGIVVISLDGLRSGVNRDILIGDGLSLVSAFLLATRQIYAARLVEGIDPNKILLTQFMTGTVLFFAASAVFESEPWSWAWQLWTSLAYQGIVIAGFGFIASLWLISRYFPSRLAALGLISPVSGIVLAWIILGEEPTSNLWAGAILVMIGAGLAQRRKRAPETTAPGPAAERATAD